MVVTVGVQEVLESTTDVQLVIRAAELHRVLELGVVGFDVRVTWHGWGIISYLVGTGKRPEGVSQFRHPFSPTRAGGEVSVTGPF